ncbi:MAG: 2-C-methyl-D-erythritol 4-phosphate cytidylyltransferase [Bacteroidales bacterium]|nr:2-C-methyl-D-erythritol 4-phosphate cytidylyltransferase [Bacteroidales bacterium]MCF6341476.1 2-C-methyl-D-erythritol 4-phosphate cytidylyltransferase [Bacteroidales bacterium]
MKKYVIILAGGRGKRMGTEQPKQFLELGGLPLLMHTFHAFSTVDNTFEFILVLPSDFIDHWKKLCKIHAFNIPHQLVESGPKRFHSVKSGLRPVPENALVAIHDGVRPFVSAQIIENCFSLAARKGCAVPVVPLSGSVREISGSLSKSFDRNKLRLVQTPQVFLSSNIKRAYQQPYNESFTDDATVLENAGSQIHLVEGNPENMKITHPADLVHARVLLSEGLL